MKDLNKRGMMAQGCICCFVEYHSNSFKPLNWYQLQH